LQRKVLKEYDLSGYSTNLEEIVDPDSYNFSNVVNRQETDNCGIEGLSEELGTSLIASYEKLKENVISALILRQSLPQLKPLAAPFAMVDTDNTAGWWDVAHVVQSICNELGIYLCSYKCENSGALFIHLAPQPGDSLSAAKSKGQLRGHTDAVALPFPNENIESSIAFPSPDLVILACIRNPNSVATRLAPLSAIVAKLPKDIIEKLQEPHFDIFPQMSFAMPEGYKLTNAPVIVRDHFEGDMIRFSHSKITPSTSGDKDSEHALEVLKSVVAESYNDVVLNAGDLLLLNNRTAVHGRGLVTSKKRADEIDRWLMRTYGMHRNPRIFSQQEPVFELGN